MFSTLRRRVRVLLHRYPLLPFLLALVLVVDVIFLPLTNSYLTNWEGIVFGALLSQWCMLGIWVVHSFRGHLIRLVVMISVLAGISCIWLLNSNDDEAPGLFAALAANSALAWLLSKFAISLPSIIRNGHLIPRFKVASIGQVTAALFVFYSVFIQTGFYFSSGLFATIYAHGIAFSSTLFLWRASCLSQLYLRLSAHLFFVISFGWIIVLPYLLFSNSEPFFNEIGKRTFEYLMESFSMNLGFVLFSLVWSYGLQFRRHPIRQHKKKQQATPNESEQPVELKVVNQVDRDEPPGPIDLTI